jgi:5-methylcytosine-specific restriction protein A
MPTKALRGCATSGCPNLTTRTACSACESERAPRADGRPSAAARGYDARWRRRRRRFLVRHPNCVVCAGQGRVARDLEVDHVISLRRGGADHETNWQVLCHEHHSEKTAREDGAFGRRRRER